MSGPEVVMADRDAPKTIDTYSTIEGPSAMVILQEDNNFTICGPDYTSVMPTGKYRVDNGKLLLSIDGGDIIFSMEKDRLIFESGTWMENWIEKGTILYIWLG